MRYAYDAGRALMMPAGLGGAGRAGRARGEPVPLYEVNFSTLPAGRVSAATLTAMGYALTRASANATAQASASSMASTLAGTNEARVQSLGGLAGILIEPAATNLLKRARAIDVGAAVPFEWTNPSGTVTYTDSGVDILGASGTNARRVQVSAGGYSRRCYALANSLPIADHTCSLWRRTPSGTNTHEWGIGAAPGFVFESSTATTTWERRRFTDATNATGDFFVSTADGFGIGAQDIYADLVQMEQGRIATSPILTTGAQLTRNQDLLNSSGISVAQSMVTLVSTRPNLRMWLQFIPLAPMADVPAFGAGNVDQQPYLFKWIESTTVDVSINPTTRAVTTSITAGQQTFGTVLPTWVAGDLVDMWFEFGADLTTRCKARVNNGAVTNLGTAAAKALGGSPLISYLSPGSNLGAGRILPGMVTRVRTYSLTATPSWAV